MNPYDSTDFTAPPEEPLYATYFKSRLAVQTPRSARNTFLFCVLAAGPLAIITVLAYGFGGGSGIIKTVFIAPFCEELAKIATPLVILARFPWRWSRGSQPVLACVVSGIVFAAIENLLYLFVYIENPTARMIIWRWTVCVLVHTACSATAGFGLLRIWRNAHKEFTRPDAMPAAPYFVAAMVLHGAYNAAARLI